MERGLAPQTIKHAHSVLRMVLNRAVKNRMILANPAVGIELPTIPVASMSFLTQDQVKTLAHEVDRLWREGQRKRLGPAFAESTIAPFGIVVLFAAYTGLRAGEISALRVRHIDLEQGRVRVETSVAHVKGKATSSGRRPQPA